MAAGGALQEQDNNHGKNGERHDTTIYGRPTTSDTHRDKALPSTTAACKPLLTEVDSGATGTWDGLIDDTKKESEHGNALPNPLAWSLG